MSNTDTTTPDPLDSAFSAGWPTKQVLPSVEYVVPGVIPKGLTLLVAPPKIGKSWMVLGLGVSAATGGQAFGSLQVSPRPVLYLALEDGARRLQSRLRTIGVDTGPSGLYFMTEVPSGPIATIAAFLERHAARKPLAILDTLGKVRGTYCGNDAHGNNYGQMSALKNLVDAVPGSSLIVVHHTNKGEKSDFLDSVSGTQGLAGAADSILLIRRDRQNESSTLHVTSRDAKKGEYQLSLTNGTWKLDGSSLRDAAEAARNKVVTEGHGDDMAELVKVVNKYPEGLKPKDVKNEALEVYAGKGKIQVNAASGETPEAGEHQFTAQSMSLHLPFTAGPFQISDTVTVLASPLDPTVLDTSSESRLSMTRRSPRRNGSKWNRCWLVSSPQKVRKRFTAVRNHAQPYKPRKLAEYRQAQHLPIPRQDFELYYGV